MGGGDQLGQLGGGIVAGGVLAVHGTEGERHVSPVAALLGVVLVHREQLDDGESEGGDAVELADQGASTCRATRSRAWRRHAADVGLVDDRGAAGPARWPGRRPRRRPGDWCPAGVRRHLARWRPSAVPGRKHDLGRRRVEEHLGRVEASAVAVGDEAVHRSLGDLADPMVAARATAAGAPLSVLPSSSKRTSVTEWARWRIDANAAGSDIGAARYRRARPG